jgi:hypothetical protein
MKVYLAISSNISIAVIPNSVVGERATLRDLLTASIEKREKVIGDEL